MTKEQAEELGYEVIKASPFEVGLCKNGVGIRTWWCQDFDRKLPSIDHPRILATIERMETLEQGMPPAFFNRPPD